MGIYQTPYEHFRRLSCEMWRACRLVIDTDLYDQGWTRQQAMDYLASNTALSQHNVHTKVDRYSAWPGQALAYKIEELTLRELRGLAETHLGERFDLRTFHNAVLTGGGLPLELLRERIEQYIKKKNESIVFCSKLPPVTRKILALSNCTFSTVPRCRSFVYDVLP